MVTIRPSVDGLYRDDTGRISRERRMKRFLTVAEKAANRTSKPRISHSRTFSSHRMPYWVIRTFVSPHTPSLTGIRPPIFREVVISNASQ